MSMEFVVKVIDNYELIPNYYCLVLEKPEDFTYLPGQYVDVLLETTSAGYSLVSTPSDKDLRIIYRKTGDAPTFLLKRKKGDELRIRGPLGNFVMPDESHEIMYLASEIGITPIVSHLRHVMAENLFNEYKITLWWELQDKTHNFLESECEEWKKKFNVHVLYKDSGEKSRIIEHMEEIIKGDSDKRMYYFSGPTEFVQEIERFLARNKIPLERTVKEDSGFI